MPSPIITQPLRLVGILRVLAKHDALAALEEARVAPALVKTMRLVFRRRREGRPGEKLARALTELGPSFIKLGQFIATRGDLVGERMAGDLSQLQDRLQPFSFEEVRKTLEEEFGRPLEELFESFEDRPVSAASIAQVHYALTRPAPPSEGDPSLAEGEEVPAAEPREVAVKVLRPGIEKAFARDLELFRWLAETAEFSAPQLRRFRPREVVEVFAEQVGLEMDLRLEAAAASELAENFDGDPSYRLPEVDWERTSRRVLTLTRLSGIRLDDREALLEAGHDLEEVLTNCAQIFFNQVFRDGFFHGDQHPGNMFVLPDGAIGAVDFGIMGRLDKKTRFVLADMLLATLQRDYKRLAEVQVQAGWLPPDAPLETFAQALRAVCEPIFGRSLAQISFGRLLGQLLALTKSFDMPVQPHLVLMQKNMLMAEGVSRRLDPRLNIWTLAEPLIVEWMRENRGLEARARELTDSLREGVQRLPQTLDALRHVGESLKEGQLRLHPDTVEALTRSGRRGRWMLWLALAFSLSALILAISALD